MRYGSIYVATNAVTGEQYVGQTRQRVERRWKCHVNAANSSVAKKHDLAKAILKYGKESIRFEEIYAAFDADELDAAEMNYIEWLRPAYNRTNGGAGHRGVDCSDSLKKSRSERMSKLWSDPEWKAKQVSALRASNSTEANRTKMKSIQMLGTKARWAGHVKPEKPNKLESFAIRARKNWKPVYCPEIQVTFFSNNHAADYFGVDSTTVCKAIKNRGKVKSLFTLLRVK